MRITVEGTTYQYDGRLMLKEARDVKTYAGMSLQEFDAAAKAGDVEAVGILVWLCRRRAGETGLKYSDVDFDLSQVEIVDDGEAEAEVPTKESQPTG